jgi:hypothetical protein
MFIHALFVLSSAFLDSAEQSRDGTMNRVLAHSSMNLRTGKENFNVNHPRKFSVDTFYYERKHCGYIVRCVLLRVF